VTVAAPAAAEWAAAWRGRLERAPRVLHLGNIANNAYLNAKILRSSGVEADVLCCDYYHIMGCPEWEDADLAGDHGSDDLPDWYRRHHSNEVVLERLLSGYASVVERAASRPGPGVSR